MKQANKVNSQMKRTKMMESVNMIVRGYERATIYGKKEDDRKFEESDKRTAKTE